jgi:alpha-tubulin suppressor-like RCC1 family protein
MQQHRAVTRSGRGRPEKGLCRSGGPALASIVLATVLFATSVATASAVAFGAAAWGYNGSGQLGNGTTTISHVPVAVSGLSGVTAVAAGGEHSLALLSNGTVMAWGSNREGQLGTGNTTSSRVPVAVPGLSGVTAIAAGKEHSLALLSNGTVMAWGGNEEGQLGAGKTTRSTVPVAVKGLTGVSAIAAGGEFSVARLSNGTAMSWGCNGEGQLGDGKMSKSLAPVAVKGLSGVVAISAGGEHVLALLSGGKVMSWGSNEARQLGIPAEIKKTGGGGEEEEVVEEIEPENSDVPVAVQGIDNATAVAAGGEHSLALLGTGQVMAWGSNRSDQLGNGSSGGASNVPSAVEGLGGVTAIAAGQHHSLARLSGGTLVAWGYNPDGQLGNGSNLDSPVPVAVSGLGAVAGIAAGGSHSLSYGPPAPSVGAVSPSGGPQPGGTQVTITGANFAEATAVHFGASAAASFTVESSSTITAISPPGMGTIDVTITTAVSTSAAGTSDKFAYLPPPTVAKVKPNKGPAIGGTTVAITGTNLTGATGVAFGASAAASFTVNSATSITAVTAPGTSGTVDATVSTPSGTSAISKHDHFKYESPTVASLTPAGGPKAGGSNVTVSGSGFAPGGGATEFKFGKVLASSVECSSTTSCTLVTAATSKAGTVDVVASVGKAKSKKDPLTDQFAYE